MRIGRVLGPIIIYSAYICLSFQTLGHKFWCHADQFVWKIFVGSSFESMQFFWLVSTSFSGFFHLTCSLQPSGGAFSQSSGLWLGRSWWGYNGGGPGQTCDERHLDIWLCFVVMIIGWFISENVNKIKKMFLLNQLQSKLYCFWPKTSQDTEQRVVIMYFSNHIKTVTFTKSYWPCLKN